MAYEKTNEETLAEIKKNDRGDFILVKKVTGVETGNESVDVRLYYTDDNGEIQPTKKGVRFNSEMAGDVAKAIVSALSESEKEQLVKELISSLPDETQVEIINQLS